MNLFKPSFYSANTNVWVNIIPQGRGNWYQAMTLELEYVTELYNNIIELFHNRHMFMLIDQLFL